MRKFTLAFLLVLLLVPAAVHAQTPQPPPTLASCLPWDFDGAKCLEAGGVWGIILFVLLSIVFFILTDIGKQAWEGLKARLTRRPESLFTEAEKAQKRRRHQARLLEELEEQQRKAEWLNRLARSKEILRPAEEQIFVDLSMDLQIELSRRSEESKTYSPVKSFSKIEDAVNFPDERSGKPYPVLALLGEPGAGKSTLLRRLARQAAQAAQADPAKPWVLFVPLSDYNGGSAKEFLRSYWEREVGYDGFNEALAAGNVWLFLDGLNEVPRKLQDSAKAAWRLFLNDDDYFHKKGNRAVITSRTADYGDGVGAPRLEVKRMNPEQMQAFLQKRGAEGLWEELDGQRKRGGESIYDLARIPFWLDKMELIFEKGKKLPENRFDLVSQLAERWLALAESRDALQHPLTENERRQFWDALTRAAWKGMSSFGPNPPMPTQTLLRLFKNPALREEDVLEIAKSCGFLVNNDPRGLQAKFFHQLLQEYFAAREFARQFAKGKNLSQKWKTDWRRWKFVKSQWDPMPPPLATGWEETIVLAAGALPQPQAEKLVLRILARNSPLAARCLLESGAEMGEQPRQACALRLQRDLQNPRVRLPMRLAAGKALAKLGDPRFEKQEARVGEKKVAFIAPEWREVPAGRFQMGTDSLREWTFKAQFRGPAYFGDEKPAHSVFLSAFKIARYPVTVAEYRCFMDAGGYENDDYWKEEGALRWRNAPLPFEETYAYKNFQALREQKEQVLQFLKWEVKGGRRSPQELEAFTHYFEQGAEDLKKVWEENEKTKRNGEGKVVQPYLWDNPKYAVENQPVIGVSWYEACAYAAWLTEVLRANGGIAEGEFIRLPTEAEWEKSARGNTKRLWAWGSLWNAARANTIEGRVLQPSSVGAYPKNVSPYGLEEMTGNVWEWCLDWYHPKEYLERLGKEVKDPCRKDGGDARALRGGSWDGNRDYARCSCRYRLAPGDFYDNAGFRVVCSPSASLRSESL